MVENLERMLEELEGNYCELSFVGSLEDEVTVNELHTEVVKYQNGRDYIVTEDLVDSEQHIPRIAVDSIKEIKQDCGEWLVNTNIGIDITFSIN